AVAWQFVQKPLIDLEKTRLDDQVLAFRGYTAATEKGLQNLTSGYAIWTDLFNAIAQQNRAWLKKEVSDQLILSTDVDAVQIVSGKGEILGEAGDALRLPAVASRVTPLVASGKPAVELIDTRDRGLLIISIAPIYKSDRSGNSPGTLILGQKMDQPWLHNFLSFSQPTTKLQVISFDGKPIISSNTKVNIDDWETTNLTNKVLPTIQKGQSVYRIEPESGLNTIYAPIFSQNKPVAIAKIQIVSKYFNQASLTLNRLIWMGLALASLLSVAIAHLLAKQIGEPIILLAKRSKTLAAGDLTTPIPGVGAGGEIGQLANAYQDMAQALKTLIDNLEQRVAERTQELEKERNSLEDRVYKRTQEFWKKNYQLQQAHDQLQLLNSELIAQANQLREALRSLKIAQVQLIQTEKMSSLGQLVAGIAHEINNPINFIYANLIYVTDYTQNILSLVQRYQQSYTDPQIEKYTEEIELDFLTEDLPKILYSMKTGADRVRQIVLSLHNFSRLDQAGMKQVDIHEGIDSSLLILQSRLQSCALNKHDDTLDIKIIKQYGELPHVECYPGQMNQVFMNILSNAVDALLYLKEKPNKTIYIQTELTGSELIKLTIKDNGPGIKKEVISKVFDPFFTTKPPGKGIGLGLTTSYQILQEHQGRIDIISQPGEGTEVVIELPIKNIK
ncbi:MAG: HAMP domain-containing protein, partial [Tolypothrix sp. Co-bin9]|nr:HAMP domain-containing protein [Tolypothrix sp. Co-bin9]